MERCEAREKSNENNADTCYRYVDLLVQKQRTHVLKVKLQTFSIKSKADISPQRDTYMDNYYELQTYIHFFKKRMLQYARAFGLFL